MIGLLLSFKFWLSLGYIFILLIIVFNNFYIINNSPAVTKSTISLLREKFGMLQFSYAKCVIYIYKFSNFSENDSKIFDKTNNTKSVNFIKEHMENELKRFGYYDVIRCWPKKIIDDMDEKNQSLMFINYKTINELKKFYLIVKFFFDQHKNRKTYDENKKTGIPEKVRQILNLFSKESINPTADLLIYIIYLLKSLGDNTFENDRCEIYSFKTKSKRDTRNINKIL